MLCIVLSAKYQRVRQGSDASDISSKTVKINFENLESSRSNTKKYSLTLCLASKVFVREFSMQIPKTNYKKS